MEPCVSPNLLPNVLLIEVVHVRLDRIDSLVADSQIIHTKVHTALFDQVAVHYRVTDIAGIEASIPLSCKRHTLGQQRHTLLLPHVYKVLVLTVIDDLFVWIFVGISSIGLELWHRIDPAIVDTQGNEVNLMPS